jgi:hypothetical protein
VPCIIDEIDATEIVIVINLGLDATEMLNIEVAIL